MAGRERVKQSAEVRAPPPAPWESIPAAAAQPEGLWPVAQHEQHDLTEAFEPLPDSPTGGLTAQDRSHDQQQRDTDEAQKEAVGIAQKLSPLQQVQAQADRAATKGPIPGTGHVHLIGEITGAVGLGPGPLYCTWQLVYDTRLWSIAGGQDKGRTHASSALFSESSSVSGIVWECPLDILLTASSMQHWPSIVFKLFHRSIWLGRDEFVGYSLCSLPNTPGCHHISCPVWVAAEGRRSLLKELTKHFTGLHPQLLYESFITDLEQRFEQGQHLHTVACSSTSSIDYVPQSRAMICTGGAGAAADAAALNGPLGRGHCPSLSAASSGTVAVAGSGICLRLHVLTRGLEQLSKLRGDGAESIGRCLERLHSSVEKIRKQHVKPRLQDLVGADSDNEDENSQPEATEESRGVQLVRSGRAARLDAVHRQLFGDTDAGAALQPDQQQQQPSSRRLGQGPGQASAIGAAGSPPHSSAAVRRSWGGDAGSPAGGVSSSSAGLRTLPSLQERGSSSGQSPTRRITAGGVAGASTGSPLRRDAAVTSNRWAGRFASAGGSAAGRQPSQGSPSGEGLLTPTQERSS